jgi:Na+/citrate or Na+/malate symporter
VVSIKAVSGGSIASATVVGRYLGSIDPWNETLLGCEVSIPLMCGGVGRGVVVVEE